MINVAIVGCGYWGPNMARVFSQNKGTQLYMCCDLVDANLEKMKSIYPHIKITKDFNQLLLDPQVHAVVIVTPTRTHFPLVKQALLAGKHVLVEKPMTETSSQAKELVDIAAQQNRILMVDHTFEYHPAIRKIKQIIDSKELGDIYYIKANWLNLGLLQPDVNVVFDLATHIFSIINYFTGEKPEGLKAVGKAYVREEIEEVAHVLVSYPNNVLATINVSWLEPCKQRTITIVGSKKMLMFDLLNKQEHVKVYDKGVINEGTENIISYRTGDIYSPHVLNLEPLKVEAEHFAECIRDNKKPQTCGENGMQVVRLLECVNRSLKHNGAEVLL
jgi:predicted dehydrogenase